MGKPTEPIGTEIECSQCNKKFKKFKRGRQCKECLDSNKKKWLEENKHWYNKKRAKAQLDKKRTDLKTFLSFKYSEIKRRVTTPHRKTSMYYYGLELINKDDFIKWGMRHEDLHLLFKEWNEAGWPIKLCPSIDRIDPRFGYTLLNMQWVTHSENVIRSNIFRSSGRIV